MEGKNIPGNLSLRLWIWQNNSQQGSHQKTYLYLPSASLQSIHKLVFLFFHNIYTHTHTQVGRREREICSSFLLSSSFAKT